jgi:microcin C transport system substrate-binding protein
MQVSRTTFWASCLSVLLLTACGDSSEPTSQEPARDIMPEVTAFYAEHPDFFGFKTAAELPADLVWEDGAQQPDIGSPQAKKGGTQYRRLQDFPRTLRTAGPDSNGSFRPYLLDDVGMTLAKPHPQTGDLYPGLAESWAIDKPNKTVYIKLNPLATYSDGVPITADDYLFMFWFYRTPYISDPWYNSNYSERFTNISRYSDHIISITLPQAKPDIAYFALSLRPIPRHHYNAMGEDFADRYQWQFEPTPGPYIIKDGDIRKGRSIALTRLDNWWAKDLKFYRHRFNADRVQFNVIRDTAKAFEAFKRGDIDQFGLGLAEYWYEKLSDTNSDVQAGYIKKAVFYNQRPRPPFGLWINTARPLLDNLDLRQGIAHATNWQLVIDQFFRGDSSRLNDSNDGFGEFSHPSLKGRAFDIEQALQYFTAAGFSQRGRDGILMNAGGERLSFTLTTGYASMKDVLTILKQEAAKAGLEYRIEVLDGTAAWKKVQEKKHDISFTAFGRFLEMYPRFWEHYHSFNAYDTAFLQDGSINPQRKLKTQTNNLESFARPEMDQLIEQYRASEDKQEMIELAHRMIELHHDHASFVPGFYQGFFRLGYWRWLHYPEEFSYKHASGAGELFVEWIDATAKQQTLDAKKSGEKFESSITIYDQWAE